VSEAVDPRSDTPPSTSNQLTPEEREAFEDFRDNAEDYPNPEFMRGLAEIVLQSDSTREETNS